MVYTIRRQKFCGIPRIVNHFDFWPQRYAHGKSGTERKSRFWCWDCQIDVSLLDPVYYKAELPQEGILFCTQFSSLGIFIKKKVGNRKN